MAERSGQSLWKILTGHSAIQNTDLILSEVKTNKSLLVSGIAYFKPPSSASESKLLSSKDVSGKSAKFIQEISKKLNLDQWQSFLIFKSFLLEGYCGSLQDIHNLLPNSADHSTLLVNIEDYYYRERLYILRCVKQILGYWQDGSHPFRVVYERCVDVLEITTVAFVSGVWKQFDKSVKEEIPTTVETPDGERKWVHQLLLEQCELLEILLLFYKDFEFPPEKIVGSIKQYQGIGFGYESRGRCHLDVSSQLLSCHINHLYTIILLEAFYIEWLLKNKSDPAKLHKHRLSGFKESKSIDSLLQEEPSQCSPLLLAWSVLCYMLTDDEDQVKYLEQMRQLDCQSTFAYLLKMLESPFLSGDRPVAVVGKSIINTLVSLVISLFSEDSLGDIQVLLDISSHVLTHPRLRLEFWENGLDDGLGVLLVSAVKRLPFEIDHVLKLLLSLSQDELSAQRVFMLLNELNFYTEECPDNVLNNTNLILKHPRVLFEKEYLSLGLPPLLMPPGTKGVVSCSTDVMEEEDKEPPRTICWELMYSVWDYFAVQLIHLLHTSGIGMSSESHPVVDYVTMIIKLTARVIKYNWSVSFNIGPLLSNVYSVLHKFSGLLHPPVFLIAECINCLAVMAENQAKEVWRQLAQTGFLPQLIGSPQDLQISPSHYCNILNVWERAHGCYAVTLAMMRLLHSSLSSSDTISEYMLATIVYIMQAVFLTSQNWRYNSQKDREEFCHLILKLCLKVLETTANKASDSIHTMLHDFTVDLLLTSSGHVLIINVLGMGVSTVNKLMASSHNWCQTSVPIESLKISFKITDLLLQCKKTESVTPLEEALATRTVGHSFFSASTPQHIVTRLASYIYHHDDNTVPISAIQLLTRLASVAPMSMFSCLGQEALALRDNFVTRLSARTESNNLRIAILNLISVSMGTQPGLLELFLSLSLRRKNDSTSQKKEMIRPDSCLYPVLNMIDPKHQVPPVVSSLLSAGMHLLRVLWEGRHVAALEAVRSSDKFWEHLMKVLYDNLPHQSVEQDTQQTHKIRICVEIFHIIALELYYVNVGDIDKDLITSIGKFVSDGLYKRVCKVFQAKPQVEDSELSYKSEVGAAATVSVEIIKVQYDLAEVWKRFLLVALHHHESLFELHSNDKKEVLLQELLASLMVQTERLPQSLSVVTELLTLYLSLLKKWTSVTIPCKVIGRFIEILFSFINCEYHPNLWETLPLVYSCLICIVRSLKQNETELEVRYTHGLIPLIVQTLTHYTQYLSMSTKHYPEVYSVYLLSELTATILEDDESDQEWLLLLQDHSVVMILVQACIGHCEALSHPDFVNACFSFFLTLAMSNKGSRVLSGNNIFQLLNVSLCVVVDKLNPQIQIGDVKSLKELMPPSQWLKVWLSALKLVSNLLCSQGHYVIEPVINFIGAHYDRLAWVLDIYIATRFMESLEETESVCQFFQVLVEYRSQWRTVLLQQHNITIERLLNLFNGAIAVLHRNRIKDVIKTMDSHGLLQPEESSNAIKTKEHFSPKVNDDSWIKFSPAYLRVRDKLVSISISCLSVLNCYTPPLNDLFMCSFTQPLDLLEWPPLFHLFFDLPVLDPTCPPSISTLTGTLNVGCELLKKSDPSTRSSFVTVPPFRSPSKSSPLKSPVTPAPPHRSHSTPAVQQKRAEILLMLELAVVLLMSQSVRYIIDSEVDIVQKQALKKLLVSELGNFCQVLILNFHRKGAPSPRSSSRLSLSSSRTTTSQDSSSGRASSSHSFSDGLEQGLFKLADMFYKSKLLS
ncbi:PREDICTED: nucleoporin NUP188 homolog [Amphimedon queenslandica]|uniref:Nucleoporin NUP188 n=1 Tax=Amphimedon queenslandica TaxID=400682 RepID=A0AAN0J3H3_AMPQE|nr:PREDICTED: nucleoporin NUP188 homolog [Amphimedon queenslandica]|eukprot:XP_019851271.1 PREDICTED: nucleoporin NUP188 homolog [Amphimedon queenslandica]